jgi:hypothetical protein
MSDLKLNIYINKPGLAVNLNCIVASVRLEQIEESDSDYEFDMYEEKLRVVSHSEVDRARQPFL